VGGLVSRFNWIDLLAGILLLRLGVMGFRLGLGAELTKLAGLLVGLFASFHWYQAIGDWVATRTAFSHEWAGAVALVVLVLVPYVAVGLLLRLLQKAAMIQFAPSLSKVGGVVVSVVRAGLVMSVLLVAFQQLPSEYLRASIEERSWSGRYLARMAPAVYDAVTPLVTRHLPVPRAQPVST